MTFDKDYFETGIVSGKSLYQNYRWIPELTIPLAHNIIQFCSLHKQDYILDFGCAKGYLVHALRLLGHHAYGVDISEYAINECPKEIEEFIKLYNGVIYFEREGRTGTMFPVDFDWIIAKDVFEHVPEILIDPLLTYLATVTKKMFVIVPLSNDGVKYNVPAYELDTSHLIRKDLAWWEKTLEDNGFAIIAASTDPGQFKPSWSQHKDANGMLIGSIA